MPASSQEIANAVAKQFGGSANVAQAADPKPAPTPGSMDSFHNDLSGQICPDCHSAVKRVIQAPPSRMSDSDEDAAAKEIQAEQAAREARNKASADAVSAQ